MVQSYPAFALFPDLNCVIRTPSGVEYRGNFRQHPSTKEEGEHWYEGFVTAGHKDHILADTNLSNRFKRHAERPAYFHPQSNAEPMHLKLNRIPKAQRTEKNEHSLIGEIWTHEGLWTVIASLSQSPKLHLAGNVVPARVEIEHDGSAIARYHVAPAAAEVVAETKPAPKRAGAKPS